MQCPNCGHPAGEGLKFCTKCGTPLTPPEGADAPLQTPLQGQAPQTPLQSQSPQTPVKEKKAKKPAKEPDDKPKKSKAKLIVILSLVGVLLVAAVVAGAIWFFHHQSEKKWDAYVTELEGWLEEAGTKAELCYLDDEAQEKLETLEGDLRKAIEGKESTDKLEEKKTLLDDFLTQLAKDNETELNTLIQQLDSQELSFAQEDDLTAIAEYSAAVQELMGKGNYREAFAKAREWESYILPLGAVYNDYTVTVSQYDISDFPTVRLYLDVTDAAGNFVDNLPASAFYVNEGRTIDGPMTRAAVTRAAKLNENAGISISLVADISGSMSGSMEQAKQAMRNFVGTVQFEKGDHLELTEFNETAYICQSFTDQPGPILNSINAMQAGGETRLYDTLLSEIERIQSQGSAKCVIGFTDGQDTISVSSAQDVIDTAVRRGTPVFLVGIGSNCDDATLRRIATSTGGSYQNIANVSSLESVYSSIYRQEKEVYLVEYVSDDGDNFDDARYSNIYIRTPQGTGGYAENFSYEPRDFFEVMYNKFLIAGIDCQTKGERNLLDSGLIVTTPEAYADPNCIAYQSQKAIDTGGAGANNSSIFLVLVDHAVMGVEPSEDGYILYGMSNYDVSKTQSYGKISNTKEKDFIQARYGTPDNSTQFWIEENRYNYEKLHLIKDTDGKWKFLTRVYERQDGGQAVTVNQVYNAIPQS